MADQFKLKEDDTKKVREVSIKYRELTHGERLQMLEIGEDDAKRVTRFVISKGMIDPAYTEEEALQIPGEIVTELTQLIFEISGIKRKLAEPPKKD